MGAVAKRPHLGPARGDVCEASVWENCPAACPPSWETRSTSKNPGRTPSLREGPDRDLRAKDAPGLGLRAGPKTEPIPVGGQQPVDRRGGDAKELLPLGLGELELSGALERLDDLGHERGQSLAAGAVQRRPDAPERLQHLGAVDPGALLPRGRVLAAAYLGERPASVGPAPARERAELVERPALLGLGRRLVAPRHLPGHGLALGHRESHRSPPPGPEGACTLRDHL